jgi:hypothetical protein
MQFIGRFSFAPAEGVHVANLVVAYEPSHASTVLHSLRFVAGSVDGTFVLEAPPPT